MGDVGYQRGVLLAQSVPVITVHIFGIEKIAVAAPNFIEYFRPFLLGHAIDQKIGGGNDFGACFAFGLVIKEFIVAFEADHDFLAVIRNVVGANIFRQGRFLAVFQGVKDQSRGREIVSPIEWRSSLAKYQVVVGDYEAFVVVTLDRNASDAGGKSVEIDVNVRFRLLVFACFRFVFLFFIFAPVFDLVRFSIVCTGGLFTVFRDGDFVAFGWKRILAVFAKCDRKYSVAAIGRIIKFNLAESRLKIVRANVIKIIAVGIPGRIGGLEQIGGHAVELAVAYAPDINGAKTVRIGHGKSKVAAIVGPDVIAYRAAGIPCDLHSFFVINGKNEKFAIFIREGEALSVIRPFGRIKHGLKTVRRLFRFSRAVLIGEINFVFAIKIRDESDFCAIRRPTRPLIVGI